MGVSLFLNYTVLWFFFDVTIDVHHYHAADTVYISRICGVLTRNVANRDATLTDDIHIDMIGVVTGNHHHRR